MGVFAKFLALAHAAILLSKDVAEPQLRKRDDSVCGSGSRDVRRRC